MYLIESLLRFSHDLILESVPKPDQRLKTLSPKHYLSFAPKGVKPILSIVLLIID